MSSRRTQRARIEAREQETSMTREDARNRLSQRCTAIARIVLLLVSSMLAGAFSGGIGCAGEADPASSLRLRFPDQAAAVLEGDEAFVPAEDGFVPASSGERG